MKIPDSMSGCVNFEQYKGLLIERILEREPGIAFNLLESVDPENYINNPIQEIPLDRIDNMPSGASVVKHGLEQFAKGGHEPDHGAFHNIRFGKKVDIPIAVSSNKDGTFSIVDGFHRVVQTFINGDKAILAFVEGGDKGMTLKELYDQAKSER